MELEIATESVNRDPEDIYEAPDEPITAEHEYSDLEAVTGGQELERIAGYQSERKIVEITKTLVGQAAIVRNWKRICVIFAVLLLLYTAAIGVLNYFLVKGIDGGAHTPDDGIRVNITDRILHLETERQIDRSSIQTLEALLLKVKDDSSRLNISDRILHLETDRQIDRSSIQTLEALLLKLHAKDARECSDLSGLTQQNGSFTIYPYGSTGKEVSVYCVFNSDGVWTVIQRRLDGSVNFTRNWMEYKNGFGSSSGEYWIGNDILYHLKTQGNYRLKIVLKDWEETSKYAIYERFSVSDESDKYRLSIGDYTGNAGDAMTDVLNGMKFSTYDSDNDKDGGNCAARYRAGWWFNFCYDANLNGVYSHTPTISNWRGIIWYLWHGWDYSLKQTTMMIQKK